MTPGRVVLITGASSGIGAATARLLGREGYRVVLAARREDRLESVAADVRSSGGHALVVPTDLTRREEIGQLVQRVRAEYGAIDVLFNNAGMMRLGWLETLTPEEIASQLEVNALGTILTTRAVLPHLIERGEGHIINMSSVAGFIASPTYTAYAASKFALRGFTEALRREVRVFGIHVSGIYPGAVSTDLGEESRHRRATGVRTPDFLVLRPEQVAAGVLRVIRRPRRTLIMPWFFRLAVWIERLAPGLVDRVVEARFVRPERGL